MAVVREILESRLVTTYAAVEFDFPHFKSSLWFSNEEGRALSSALLPKLERSRGEVEKLLFDVVTLETALRHGAEPVTLAELLPLYWSEFIRKGPIEDVSPLGLK